LEKLKDNYTSLVACLLTQLYILFCFNAVLLHPNSYLLNITKFEGDGIKNYFTNIWYVAYDSGNHFTGMNYPYGEHVTFTDNQPLLAWLFSVLKHILPVDGNVVGILNVLMLKYVLNNCSV
jgi:hypothetical protein